MKVNTKHCLSLKSLRMNAKRYFFVILAMVILAPLFSGCYRTGCCTFRFKRPECICLDGRRPQVLHRANSCCIDYNVCNPCCEPEPEDMDVDPPPCIYEECWYSDYSDTPVLSSGEGWGGDDDEYNFDKPEEDRIIPLTPSLLDPQKVSAKDYRLSTGDLLEISVFGEEESLAERVVIAPDGYIYYAFLEGIPAAGRTVPEVTKDIVSRLSHLFLVPNVTVVPLTSVNNNFRIFGRVRDPGIYPLIGTTRLRDAIGIAGGLLTESFKDKATDADLLPLANLRASFVIRDKKKINVDFEQLLFNGDNRQDIVLLPEDYIYIAPSELREVYVLGAVRSPQRLVYTRNMTLINAVALVGGWLPVSPYSADLSRVLVLRGSLECPCVIQVDLLGFLNGQARDLYLQPGDIIYFQNKQFRFVRELVRLAIESFVESFADVAAGFYGQKMFPIVTDDGTADEEVIVP